MFHADTTAREAAVATAYGIRPWAHQCLTTLTEHHALYEAALTWADMIHDTHTLTPWAQRFIAAAHTNPATAYTLYTNGDPTTLLTAAAHTIRPPHPQGHLHDPRIHTRHQPTHLDR